VLDVDKARKRIALTMRLDDPESRQAGAPATARPSASLQGRGPSKNPAAKPAAKPAAEGGAFADAFRRAGLDPQKKR
jgi:uncharacterized protein